MGNTFQFYMEFFSLSSVAAHRYYYVILCISVCLKLIKSTYCQVQTSSAWHLRLSNALTSFSSLTLHDFLWPCSPGLGNLYTFIFAMKPISIIIMISLSIIFNLNSLVTSIINRKSHVWYSSSIFLIWI